MLVRDSIAKVFYKTNRGCKVTVGRWVCPYTGLVFTNPRKLDIDHVVPLKEAYLSGGHSWSKPKKRRYANDMDGLLAVQMKANRQKGSSDPVSWMPQKDKCSYLKKWGQIKKKYKLSMDKREQKTIKRWLKKCLPAKVKR